MLFAFAYSVLRLLLDIFDVRLRVRDPEAELLLLRLRCAESPSHCASDRKSGLLG